METKRAESSEREASRYLASEASENKKTSPSSQSPKINLTESIIGGNIYRKEDGMSRLVNKKAVKNLVKECKKQASTEFLEQLEFKVRALILTACRNARHFKRLKAAELM